MRQRDWGHEAEPGQISRCIGGLAGVRRTIRDVRFGGANNLRLLFRSFMRQASLGGRANALDLNAGNTLAIHFDDREPKTSVLKTLTALGNKAKLVQHEAADGSVGRVLRQSDVVLGVEVANV